MTDPASRSQESHQGESLGGSRHVGWAIIVDYQVTRRKRYHQVWAPDRSVPFMSYRFWECVEYLAAEGINDYEVRASMFEPPYVVRRLIVRKG